MNILIDGLHLAKPSLRGVGHYTRTICKAIDQCRIGSLYISIATIKKSNIRCIKQHLLGINHRLIVIPIPGRVFFSMIRYFDFFTYLKSRFPIDIVHIPYELHYKTKSKNTMTIHGMSPFVYPRNSPFENRFRRSVVASTNYVSKYISVSQKTKDEMMKYLALADHDVVPIPISLEGDFFNQERGISPTGHLEIVCYGAFERNKNHKNLVKALDSIYNRGLLKFRLVVIGDGKWGFEEAAEYLQRPYIRNIGYLNHRELMKILSGASCVIIPSIYEGFGLSLVESLALGTPVLASHAVHALDYVKEGYIGFNPHSCEEIISAIVAFSKDQIEYKAAAGRERDRLKKTLDLKNMAFLLRDVYEDIIAIQ